MCYTTYSQWYSPCAVSMLTISGLVSICSTNQTTRKLPSLYIHPLTLHKLLLFPVLLNDFYSTVPPAIINNGGDDMDELGLSFSELESRIMGGANSILARGTSGDATAFLAGIIERALRDVAMAIVENNKRIAEQLENAGFKFTE